MGAEMITLSQEVDKVKTSIEMPDDADIHEFMACVKSFALAIGYHPKSIEDVFEENT